MLKYNEYLQELSDGMTLDDVICQIKDDAIEEISGLLTDEIEYSNNLELARAWTEYEGLTEVHEMTELDDVLGRMYPSEFEDWKMYNFDISDTFFTENGNSSDNLCEISEIDYERFSRYIIDGICNFRDYTTSAMDEIVDKFYKYSDDLKEYTRKVENAKTIIENWLTPENADVIIQTIWNTVGELS